MVFIFAEADGKLKLKYLTTFKPRKCTAFKVKKQPRYFCDFYTHLK